ncbi:MAG: hypothetical protein LBV36_00295 [Chromatiales bacterium]|jgi:hypothetical protein|nr:hypothetical protein [Chromatiales bacterium]
MNVRLKSLTDAKAQASWLCLLVVLSMATLFPAAQSHAEFNLNWTADTTPAFPRTFGYTDEFGNSQTLTDAVIHGSSAVPESQIIVPNQTPFIYERVVDGGVSYFHMIMGDLGPANNPTDPRNSSGPVFAQEVYIRITSNGNALAITTGDQCSGPVTCTEGSADYAIGGGGGAGVINPNLNVSASSGAGGTGIGTENPQGSNAYNPLDNDNGFSGNMSANPARVQMQQFLKDGELTLDFVKNRFDEKPSITNLIEQPGQFRSTVNINSAGNKYDSDATASVVTNTMELLGPGAPQNLRPPGGGPSSTSFDMNTDSQNSVITAGRYTFTPSTDEFAGPAASGSSPGGSNGTYTYINGGQAMPDANSWHNFFEETQANPNPWSYPNIRPTP